MNITPTSLRANLSLLRRAFIVFVACMAAAIAAPGQGFHSLYSFNQSGYNPISGLIQASDGNFYGTNALGGAHNSGMVFQITPGGTLTTIYSFCSQSGCTDGSSPTVGVVQGADGNFYGAVSHSIFKVTSGGTLTTLHTFATDGSDGDGSSALIQGSDGNFYGESPGGGANGFGTVFRMTPSGGLTTLYSFCPLPNCTDGRLPKGGLIQGTDGNLYGVTEEGGASGFGTIFQMTTGGVLTSLYSFCSQTNCPDGSGPMTPLVQGPDGNFYGTTMDGGTSTKCGSDGCGTVFKITPEGTLSTVYSFCAKEACSDGVYPLAPLALGKDGNFYGTTSSLLTNKSLGYGTVFEITFGGTLLTLHSFDSSDGADPAAGLVQGTDLEFYGTTEAGGTYGGGTIFRWAGAPVASLSTTSLNFGNQALDQTSTAKTVTLNNRGSSLLIVSGVTSDGSFAISANACVAVLDPGQWCKVSVTFTPTVLGNLAGTLTFTDNASDSPQTVALSGTGVEPATLTPASVTFSKQAVGTTSAAKTFTLTNRQTVTLTGIAISVTGDFAISATTCSTSLAAKKNCKISVTFTPTQTGTRTGQLTVSDSASNNPQVSGLTGTGK